MFMIRLFFLFSFLIVGAQLSFGQTLHLYVGNYNKQYLGCLNCNSYDTDSIWNEYGQIYQ